MGIKMPSILRDAIDDMHCGITVSLQKYLGIHLEHEKTCFLQQMLIRSPLQRPTIQTNQFVIPYILGF